MNVRRLILPALLGMVFVAGIGTVVLQHLMPPSVQTIKAAAISHNGGNSYSVPSDLPSPLLFEIQTDAAGLSNAIITEDGKPLAAPHAIHKDILEQGNGRYSHWGSPRRGLFYFSTSDNSDPRTNGRTYRIVARPVPSTLGTALILAPLVAILVLQRLLFPGSRLIYGIAAIAFAVYASFFFGRVTFSPDTTTYLAWSELVPLGYPMFLSAVRDVFGLRWAGTIQMALLVFACAFVAIGAERMTSRRAVGIAVFLIQLCCTPVFLAQGWLLSEALFIPFIILNLGAAFLLISEKSVTAALLLATTAALIMFVRPAGYFAPMGIVFLLVAQRDRFWWTLRWALLPFVILMGTTLMVNYGVRGSTSQSQVGRFVFPYVAFLFEPQFASGETREFGTIAAQTMATRLQTYRDLPDRASRVTYSMNDYGLRLDALDAAFDKHCLSTTGKVCSYHAKEGIFRALFIATVRHRPLEYAGLVADGLIEAWRTMILHQWWGSFSYSYSLEAANHADLVDKIRVDALPLTAEDIALRPQLTDELPGSVVGPLDTVRVFISQQRWLVYLIGIVTLLAMPIAPFAKSHHWLALGYCGVFIHGSMLLTAAVTEFIPRYSMPVDPMILIAGVIMVDGLFAWGRSRMGRLDASTISLNWLKPIR
jgi:hypothetical protein